MIANVALALFLFMIILGVIVFIHELGHFLAAKRAGVVVQEFAFGMGPKLWGKKWKGTEYKINLLPVGGYCKMLGDQDGSSFLRYTAKPYAEADKEYALKSFKTAGIDLKTASYDKVEDFVNAQAKELKEEDYKKIQNFIFHDYIPNHPGNFENASRTNRAVIVVAGVIMNFVLGVFIYYGFFALNGFYADVPKIGEPVFWGAQVSNVPYLDYFYTTDNAFSNSAIIKADGQVITSKEQLLQIVREKYNQPVRLELQKFLEGGYEYKTAEIVLNGDGFQSVFDEDILGMPIVSKVNENSLAGSLGLEEGDVLLSLEQDSLRNETSLSDKLSKFAGKAVALEFIDSNLGEIKTVQVPIPADIEGKPILGVSYANNDPFIPFYLRLNYNDNKLFSGLMHGVNMTVYNVSALTELAKQSIAEKNAEPLVSNVSSVVGLSRYVYILVELRDFNTIISLAALVSLSLAFMNLLPIPLFDGGHLLFLIIEKIRNKPLEPALQEKISAWAFYILIGLSVLIVFKDILSFNFVKDLLAGLAGIFQQ